MKEKFGQQPENPKQHAPEAGAGPLGLPPPDPEQAPQGGGSQSPERQPLPSVCDLLERLVGVRLRAPELSTAEYHSQLREVNKSIDEVGEKGTDHDRLIIRLYSATTIQPGAGGPVIRRLSLEEFQQFRAQAEPLSEKELAEAIRKQKKENERKAKKLYRKPPGPGVLP
jgi:hypothetical protein